MKTLRAADDFPMFQSITFMQPDSEIDGRRWVTEIGIKQFSAVSFTEFTILIQIEEHSIRVNGKIIPTRPKIVPELMRNCKPSESMPDTDIVMLDEHNATDMLDLITNHERSYPILIISPTIEGKYLVEPKDLLFQLCGLAEIAQIPPGADTFRIANVMGAEFSAWRGAIRIIYPPRSNTIKGSLPYVWLIKADEIQQLNETLSEQSGHRIDQEILSIITHRTNVPNSWKHISRAMVIEHQRNLRMNALIIAFELSGKKSGELQDLVSLFEEEEERLRTEILGLKNDRESLNQQVQDQEQKIDELRRNYEQLNISLDYGRADAGSTALPNREVVIRCLIKEGTPSDVMILCEAIFGDRLLFLESARKSVRDSDQFRLTSELIDLMIKLATQYWQMMCEGKGDGEAREIFGDKSFSARESEKVEKNRSARAARTFTYKGKSIEMWRHLKIGVADNASDTIRVHFHWDHESRKIVIGHMGPHLPFS